MNSLTLIGSAASTNASSELLRSCLESYYRIDVNINKIVPIINRTSPVSLRLLDWFIVNYSRTHQTTYVVNDKYFNVHESYKAQLKAFSKRHFDPFRRNERFTLSYNKDRYETTIGQLCFFRWCLENNVLEFVGKNVNAISDDMKQNLAKAALGLASEPLSIDGKKRRMSRKRTNLTLTATRVVSPGNVKYIVLFN